jgi:hypothetical protein
VLAVRGRDSSSGFLIYELVIRGRSLFIPWRASVDSPRMKNPPDGNKSRIPYSEGSLPHQNNFLKFKHENAIKMKNKPDPALLRPSNLSNEIKKGAKISRDYPFKREFSLRCVCEQIFFTIHAILKNYLNRFDVCIDTEFFLN